MNDLYQITKIKSRYLKDVETGNYKDLPGDFYVRAFIKKYADTVGINGIELLRRFNNKLPDFQDPNYINNVSKDKLLVNAEKQRIRNRHSAVRKYIPLFTMIVIVVIVLVGIWVVAAHYHNGLTTNSGEHSTSFSGATSAKPVHKKKVHKHVKKRPQLKIRRQSATDTKLSYQINTKIKPLHLRLRSTQPIQVSVKTDDKVATPFELKAKRVKAIKVPAKAKQIQVDVSNESPLSAKINQRSLKLTHKQSIRSIILKFKK